MVKLACVLPLLGVSVLFISYSNAHPFVDQRALDILFRPVSFQDNNTIKAFQNWLRGPLFGIFNGGGPWAKYTRLNAVKTAIANNNASASDLPNRPGLLSSLGFAGLFGFGGQSSAPATNSASASVSVSANASFDSDEDEEDVPKVTSSSKSEDNKSTSTTVSTVIAAIPADDEEMENEEEKNDKMELTVVTRLGDEEIKPMSLGSSSESEEKEIMKDANASSESEEKETMKSISALSGSEEMSMTTLKMKSGSSEEVVSTTPSESEEKAESVVTAERLGGDDKEDEKKSDSSVETRLNAELDSSLLDSVLKGPDDVDSKDDVSTSEKTSVAGGYQYKKGESVAATGGYQYEKGESGGYQYKKGETGGVIHESKAKSVVTTERVDEGDKDSSKGPKNSSETRINSVLDSFLLDSVFGGQEMVESKDGASSSVKTSVDGGYEYKMGQMDSLIQKFGEAELNVRGSFESLESDEENVDANKSDPDKLSISLSGSAFGTKPNDDEDTDENEVDKKPSNESDRDEKENDIEKRRRNIRTNSQPFSLHGLAINPQEINNLRFIRQFFVRR